MFEWLTNNLLFTEGKQILVVLVTLGLVGLLRYRWLTVLAVALLFFSFYFFRNPVRVCAQAIDNDNILICPADGKIVDIYYAHNNDLQGYAQRVSIFLSPLDAHVNWLPMAGTIEKVEYKEGSFSLAFLPKSSALNERNDIVIRKGNKQILVRQIAGTIARRICCWVHKGQWVNAGDKFGMIRFGSRVDVLLPANVMLAVGMGQHVYGGYTVLGSWQ